MSAKIFMTNRARHAAVWIAWESVLLIWFASHLGRLPDDVGVQDPALIMLVITTIVGAIVVAAMVAAFLQLQLPREPQDERDLLYEALAYKDGFRIMVFTIILFVGYLFISHTARPWLDPHIITFTPVNVSLVLGFIIYLGDVARRLTMLRRYKWGA